MEINIETVLLFKKNSKNTFKHVKPKSILFSQRLFPILFCYYFFLLKVLIPMKYRCGTFVRDRLLRGTKSTRSRSISLGKVPRSSTALHTPILCLTNSLAVIQEIRCRAHRFRETTTALDVPRVEWYVEKVIYFL